MEKDHVTQFLSIHGNKFATENQPMIKRRIEALPDERFDEICIINFKNPTTTLICALFGTFGIDRFSNRNGNTEITHLWILYGGRDSRHYKRSKTHARFQPTPA